ncbi:MAG: methyltransferase domain-containing protein [Candidatus Omnitrophota bacterium]
MDNFVLVCPGCKNPLLLKEGGYSCRSCNKDYPIVDDIPCFKKDDFFWGENKEELRKIIDVAQKSSWRNALEEFFKSTRPKSLEGIIDEARADFTYILPIGKDATVLDLGCGWGTISMAMAKQYKTVFAVDAYYEKVKFLKIRKSQEKKENIIPICSDAFKLPFSDGYFDSVVLYGVLEWAGLVASSTNPLASQLALLAEANRVLKKGGCVYISIENRWALIYLLGFSDPHTNLRFISVLPRFLANIYSCLMRQGRFLTWTHSLNGYRRILRDAGFSATDFYAPLPSYRKFYYLLPLEDNSCVNYFIRYLARAHTSLAKFLLTCVRTLKINKLIKYFVSDYSIIATK